MNLKNILRRILLLLSSIFIFFVGMFHKSKEEKFKESLVLVLIDKIEIHYEPIPFFEEHNSINEYSFIGTTGLSISEVSIEENE